MTIIQNSSTCQKNSHLLQHGFNVALLLIAACGGGGAAHAALLDVVGLEARRRQQPDDSGQFLPLFFACDDEFSAGSRYSQQTDQKNYYCLEPARVSYKIERFEDILASFLKISHTYSKTMSQHPYVELKMESDFSGLRRNF